MLQQRAKENESRRAEMREGERLVWRVVVQRVLKPTRMCVCVLRKNAGGGERAISGGCIYG